MAILIEKSGRWMARWRTLEGGKKAKMCKSRRLDLAHSEAQKLEAEHRFEELHDAGVWNFCSLMGLSPNYTYSIFTHKQAMKIERFRALLREKKIDFKTPKHWRDKREQR